MIIPAHSIMSPSREPKIVTQQFDGYEVIYLSPQTNIIMARQEYAAYGLSLSGGLGSAIAGEFAIRRYGRDNLFFWFADVLKEDEDLYRFMHALMKRWGGRFYWFSSGLRPEVIWEKHHIIPNNWMCPCSYELKVQYYRQFILAMPALPHVLLGYKPEETRRQQRTCTSYAEAIPGSVVEYPLMWEPDEQRSLSQICQQDLGITPPRVYALGFDYNNCFSGEMRFLTLDGPQAFKETVGQTPFVMTSHGVWVRAPIQSFGKQQLWAIQLRKHSFKKTIYATEHHRWFAYRGMRSNNRVELLTSQLTPGTRLVSLYGRSLARVRASAFGIAHGIVFGDGTRFSGRSAPASIVLCGEKNAELLQYFPLSPQTQIEGVGVRVDDLPRFFKDRPLLNESRSYLYGWLAGYFAADGNVSQEGSVSIDSSSLENLEFVRVICTRLGIGTTPIYATVRKGFGLEPTSLYSVYLQRRTLKGDFFLLAEHRKRIQANANKTQMTPDTWIVESIERTDRIEEVFCAVVPNTHYFVLEDHILTGNCGTDCCRSGIGGRVLEAIYFPKRFQEAMEWEEMMRQKGGSLADKAFCARVVKGKKIPITLREILQEYVPLVRAYLLAHPSQPISEKTIIRETQKWLRLKGNRKEEANVEANTGKQGIANSRGQACK